MLFSEKKLCLERFASAFSSGDAKALESVLAPEFIIHEDPGVPYGGVYHGVDGFLSMLEKLHKTWATINAETRHLFDEPDGDSILAVVRLTGTARADGRSLECVNSEMWRIRERRIYEGRVWYWDAEQLRDTRLFGL